jgi:chromosome segregation ATPase
LSSARETPVRRLSNAAKAERIRSNSLSAIPQQSQSTQQPQQPPVQPFATPPQTLESLTQELDRINRETAEITAQLESEEERNRTELATLTAELDALRQKRKEDDDQKANIKAETKALEECKRTVDAQKTKLDRQLKALQDELLRLEGEESARLQDLAEREQALAELCEQTCLVEKKAEEARTVGREELAEVQRQISALDESNRVLSQRIAVTKSAAEARDSDEERLRVKAIDDRQDEEDRKVEMEWIGSEKALKAKHDLVKAKFDEVPPVFCLDDAHSRRIGSTVRL